MSSTETPAPNIPSDDDWLRDYLAERDVPCPVCSYNLRGISQPRCPECGHRLKVGVHTAEPMSKSWLTMVLLLCLGAGLGVFALLEWVRILLLAIIEGYYVIPEMIQDGTGTLILLSMVIYTACIPAAITAILTRRRFVRMTRDQQSAYAGFVMLIVGGITVVDVVWLLLLMLDSTF